MVLLRHRESARCDSYPNLGGGSGKTRRHLRSESVYVDSVYVDSASIALPEQSYYNKTI